MDRYVVQAEEIVTNVLSVSVSGEAGSFPVEAHFEAGRGITALFGASGAGKTTVLKMIAGTNRPHTGRIVAGGRVLFDRAAGVDLAPSKRQVGFVFQDGRLFPHLSVRRNLDYARWAGRRAAVRPFAEVAALLGLEHHLDRSPDTLSGGERQRVAIGRALLSDPAILILDEPLSSLDHARRGEIMPYLEAIREETSIPILYVSHEIDEIARLADTLVVMTGGKTIAAGPAPQVFGNPNVLPILGRERAGSLIEGIVTAIDAGFGLANVDAEGAALEIPADGLRVGQHVRLRIQANDVAIAATRPEDLSVRNIIRCQIDTISSDAGSPHCSIGLAIGSQRLQARITRKSLVELGLGVGGTVHALLKAVSVERHAMPLLPIPQVGDGTVGPRVR
jgi:molybdate transport system ATP-binding protein